MRAQGVVAIVWGLISLAGEVAPKTTNNACEVAKLG